MTKLTPQIKAQFSLDAKFQEYLDMAGLNPENAAPNQIQEMKRAFIAGIGMVQVLTRDSLTEYDDDTGVEILQYLMDQVTQFWIKEAERQN